jgi:hypothetical protein
MKSAHAAAASTFGVPLPSITICDINAEMLKVREVVFVLIHGPHSSLPLLLAPRI